MDLPPYRFRAMNPIPIPRFAGASDARVATGGCRQSLPTAYRSTERAPVRHGTRRWVGWTLNVPPFVAAPPTFIIGPRLFTVSARGAWLCRSISSCPGLTDDMRLGHETCGLAYLVTYSVLHTCATE